MKKSSYNITDDMCFLAVDTDIGELHSYLSDGVLESYEIIELYERNPGAVRSFDYAKRWKNPNLDTQRSDFSSMAIRQFGRLIFTFPGILMRVHNTLCNLVRRFSFSNTGINVIIVTGICGGTGSGIFIDFAYLMRHVIEMYFGPRNNMCNIFGYLFTPEVHPFGLNAGYTSHLKTNACAALKELDYFMHLDQNGGSYDGSVINMSYQYDRVNVFDMCIFGGVPLDRAEINRHKVAAKVFAESIFSLVANPYLREDDMYFSNRILSDSRPYTLIDYASAKFPYDEFASYVFSGLLKKMLEVWKGTTENTSKCAESVMKRLFGDSVELLLAYFVEGARIVIQPYDLPRGTDIKSRNVEYRSWVTKLIDNAMVTKGSELYGHISKTFDQKIQDVRLVVKDHVAQSGLYAAVELIDMLTKSFAALKASLAKEIEKRSEECNTTFRLMCMLDETAAQIPSILFMVNNENRDIWVENAVKMVKKYVVDIFAVQILEDKLDDAVVQLEAMKKEITMYIDEIENVITTLDDNCSTILRADTYMTNVYNVVDINPHTESGRRVRALLDDFTENIFVNYKDQIVCEIYDGLVCRDNGSDNVSVAYKLRNIFSHLKMEIRQDIFKCILCKYYSQGCSNQKGFSTDIDCFDNNSIVNLVCDRLYESLGLSAPITLHNQPWNHVSQKYIFAGDCFMTQDTDEIVVYGDDSVSCVRYFNDAKFSDIYGLDDVIRCYEQSLAIGAIGIHISETDECNYRDLPFNL